MDVQIENFARPSNEIWYDIWWNCENATYYQSREWAEILHTYTGGWITPAPVLFRFSDGKAALFPFSKQSFGGGIFTRYISSAPSFRPGGWIAKDNIGEIHVKLILDYIRSMYKNIRWNINPFDDKFCTLDLSVMKSGGTHVIFVEKNFDKIYKNFSSSQVRAIRKAERNGVAVREAESLADWKELYSVYKDCVRRWGKNAVEVKSWKLYDLFYQRKSPHIKLWIAEYRSNIIGGALCLLSRYGISLFAIPTLEKYFALRPASLLNYTFIKYGCENGYRWIDLGSSGKNRGLERFKEQFGSHPIPTFKYEQYPNYVQFIRRLLIRYLK